MDGAEYVQHRALLLCKWVVPSRVVFGQVGAGYFQLQLHIIACKNLLAVFQDNALKYNWLYEEKEQSCTNTGFAKLGTANEIKFCYNKDGASFTGIFIFMLSFLLCIKENIRPATNFSQRYLRNF